ncbi:hypothetical protein K435DRAFT_774933, partial [Dendrothele bispora CBS 962.96]
TALALCEAGARTVYCLDLPSKPGEEWEATKRFIEGMRTGVDQERKTRLEYVSVDVTDQKTVWKRAEEIGDRERRVDHRFVLQLRIPGSIILMTGTIMAKGHATIPYNTSKSAVKSNDEKYG